MALSRMRSLSVGFLIATWMLASLAPGILVNLSVGTRMIVVSARTPDQVAATALATTIPFVIGTRIIAGLGEAAVFVGLATAIQDLSPDDRRAEAASYFSLTIYGSLALGPPLGGCGVQGGAAYGRVHGPTHWRG